MIVSVFGSALPTPGQPAYQQAYKLGQLLAKAGHTLMTGGYCGTMEAVSRGAVEAGGHTIGVTCRQIEDYRPLRPNQWVQQVSPTDTLSQRIEILTSEADAFMALPGGVGTLAEVAIVFNKMVISTIPSKPLILIGQGWEESFRAFFRSQAQNINDTTRNLPHYVADVAEAARFLELLTSGE